MSTHDDDDRDDKGGYGRPPKSTQFKKGQSGNPNGRPKGAQGITASLKRELNSKITVTEGQQTKTISKAEAVAKRLLAKALVGDLKALLKLIEIDPQLFGVEADQAAQDRAKQPEAVDLAMLRHFFAAQERPRPEDDGEGEEPA
ncbi:DUF5681 domain-containing protein [Roseibacterium sp. SDUM158017]|uniref:DUF5681 domain-containing protein n=1 Tax=Roseicyclus salinarum TaxID=3036773 RepID=UPI0024150EB7|nr:DUF5681 domain-containing protein [Roseibacterium sp. SDUM158017]MDG4649355.1 DUF5681 domain-containing protein [Roseibacterium sp. SDUM158017]